jgi:hypothetical protein
MTTFIHDVTVQARGCADSNGDDYCPIPDRQGAFSALSGK